MFHSPIFFCHRVETRKAYENVDQDKLTSLKIEHSNFNYIQSGMNLFEIICAVYITYAIIHTLKPKLI